jgi:SAM-dependent methyltransferase
MTAGWSEGALASYRELIEDKQADSRWLREAGLKTPITWLLDHYAGLDATSRVLDVGAGTGWLAAHYLRCRRAGFPAPEVLGCDVLASPGASTLQDVGALAFRDCSFDAVVVSLVLIYLEELQEACTELFRVTRPGGSLVVSIMHPMFYRMGEVEGDGAFRVTKVYSEPWQTRALKIAGKVGPFTYCHRPLMSYLNSLADAGWSLRRVWEWSIDMHAYGLMSSLLKLRGSLPRTDKVPMFAHFLLQRPGE